MTVDAASREVLCRFLRASKVVLVDADDTLWLDGIHFRHLRASALRILGEAAAIRDERDLDGLLLRHRTGPGERAYVEALLSFGDACTATEERISQLRTLAVEFLQRPIQPLPGVTEVLQLPRSASWYVTTKGVAAEQLAKLDVSGLGALFDGVRVLAKKSEPEWRKIVVNMGLSASEFVVVGNSLRNDIVPVLSCGGFAVWLNHGDNEFGRDSAPPPGRGQSWIEVTGWDDIQGAWQGCVG